MPGNAGGDSDAKGAYTQVVLEDAWKLLGGTSGDCMETWISLPRARRPKDWDGTEDLICLLRLNLYGHPLAVINWEKHCQKVSFGVGFVKARVWKCLYIHRAK